MKHRLKRARPVLALLTFFSIIFWVTLWPLFLDPLRQYTLPVLDDRFRQFAADAFYMDVALHNSEFPLWNPLILCGTPFAANPQTSLFYPPNLIRSLLTFSPSPHNALISIGLLVWAHYLLMTLSTYFLAKSHRLKTFTALMCACALALSPATPKNALNQIHFLYMVAWVPLILLLLRNSLTAKTRRRQYHYLAAAGLCYGIQVLDGTAQLLIYASVIYGTYYVGTLALQRISPNAEVSLEPSMSFSRGFSHLLIFVVIGSLLGAALLIPAAQLADRSPRGKEVGETNTPYEIIIDIPVYKLMKMTNARNRDAPFQKYRAVTSLIFMLIPLHFIFLLCATQAVFHPRWKEIVVLTFSFLAIFDCAIGAPFTLAGLIEKAAPFSFSISLYAATFVAVPVALLAAFGLEAATIPPKNNRRSVGRIAYQIVTAAALAFVFLRFPEDSPYLTAIFAITAAGALMTLLTAYRFPKSATALLALFFVIEAALTTYRITHVASESIVKIPAATPQKFSALSNKRNLDRVPNLDLLFLKASINGYQPAQLAEVAKIIRSPEEEQHYNRAIAPRHLAQNPYISLFLKRYFWLLPSYVKDDLPDQKRLFPSTQFAFLPHARDLPVPAIPLSQLPETTLSTQAKELRSYGQHGDPIPTSRESERDDKKIVRIAFPPMDIPPIHSAVKLDYSCPSPGHFYLHIYDLNQKFLNRYGPFEISHPNNQPTAFEWPLPDIERFNLTVQAELDDLEGQFQLNNLSIAIDLGDENNHIRILSYTANRVDVALIDLPDHRILAFIDADYPGWQAYIDNEPVPILRANDAFKAVLVPPGTHQVTFIFRPKIVYIGAGISIATGAFIIAFLIATRRKQNTPDNEKRS